MPEINDGAAPVAAARMAPTVRPAGVTDGFVSGK
jgi:hypothetical protein